MPRAALIPPRSRARSTGNPQARWPIQPLPAPEPVVHVQHDVAQRIVTVFTPVPRSRCPLLGRSSSIPIAARGPAGESAARECHQTSAASRSRHRCAGQRQEATPALQSLEAALRTERTAMRSAHLTGDDGMVGRIRVATRAVMRSRIAESASSEEGLHPSSGDSGRLEQRREPGLHVSGGRNRDLQHGVPRAARISAPCAHGSAQRAWAPARGGWDVMYSALQRERTFRQPAQRERLAPTARAPQRDRRAMG